METEALRWFQQVADGVTVTEVGDLEMISQPAVSRALARLERQVGAPLLYRTGRTLRMTRAGSAFKRHVDALLHELDDGLAAVAQLADPGSGTVALAFQHSLGTWLVPDLIRSMHVDRPGVQFALTQVTDEPAAEPAAAGSAELVLGSRAPGPGYGSHPLTSEPLRLVTATEHRLRRRRHISLRDVAGEPFVGLRTSSALRAQTDELCARAGFSPAVVFEGDDLSTVRGLVAAGLGVAVVPAPRAGTPEAAGSALHHCAIDDPAAVRQIRLSWPADRRLTPVTEAFRDHVVARAVAGRIPRVGDGLD
jgi:LysR family transcriptional regulator, transcription activator of glutamate synthase operon